MKYTDQLKGYEGDLSLFVEDALEEIKTYFSLEEVSILRYDQYYIAVPVVFRVSFLYVVLLAILISGRRNLALLKYPSNIIHMNVRSS